MARRKSGVYIHGYDRKEQMRLVDQAEALEPWIYEGVDFGKAKRILEVGCGVGAQTKILLRRFPRLKIDAVDLSSEQLGQAAQYLRREIGQGRVRLFQADATDLSVLGNTKYDGAFVCWFLEHVPDAVGAMVETHRHLKRGAPIFVTEVFNQTLFLEPYSEVFLRYWFEFNDFQWQVGGHPFIGASLGAILSKTKFRKVDVGVGKLHFDSRDPKRRAFFIDFFGKILLSAAPHLVKERRVSPQAVKALKSELSRIKRTKDSVFFYAWMRASAIA